MKDQIPTFHINLDEKCINCGRSGATKSGLCVTCISKGVKRGNYKHQLEKLIQKTKEKLRRGCYE